MVPKTGPSGNKLRLMSASILLGRAGICASLLLTKAPVGTTVTKYHLVHTESEAPISLDPLDSDYGNNLHASQMIHRTLLEVSSGNSLASSILEEFSYSPENRVINFKVSDRATFSDGSPIRGEDVALTIKRMMLKRPDFPVLKHIQGISEWIELRAPLTEGLSGIKVKGQDVTITLRRHVNTPLFRFALPLFGVVKSDCVDLENNKLRQGCATSGYYGLGARGDSQLIFKVNGAGEAASMPSEISLDYIKNRVGSSELAAMSEGSYVVLSQAYSMKPDHNPEAHGFNKIEHANSRFTSFLLNPESSIFLDKMCRRIFAETVRKHIDHKTTATQREYSLFSRILPGHLSAEELEAGAEPITPAQRQSCLKVFSGKTIRWMPSLSNDPEIFNEALAKAVSQLQMKLEVIPRENPKVQFDQFLSGKLDILLGGSGFWPFDPVGDVQMLFTKGLHKPLSFVTRDPKLQEQLDGLEFLADPADKLKKLNRYIYDHALINIYSHSKRLYYTKGLGIDAKIPVAITPPAPWQMFKGIP